jgi:hypothetical protein
MEIEFGVWSTGVGSNSSGTAILATERLQYPADILHTRGKSTRNWCKSLFETLRFLKNM